MRLAALEVDLVGEVDRLLGTGVHARVAARAEVEVDRILLRPGDVERAEPAGDLRDASRVHRKVARGRKLGAGRAAGDEDRDAEMGGQRAAPTGAPPRPDRRSADGLRSGSSTRGTGAGSGNPASASSAAIFGVAALASADQPPVSRMLTNRIVCVLPPSSATSPKSRASCVQATTTSPAASPANAASSFWHSIVRTSGVPARSSARASAAASSGIVPLHEQRWRCLSARLIGAPWRFAPSLREGAIRALGRPGGAHRADDGDRPRTGESARRPRPRGLRTRAGRALRDRRDRADRVGPDRRVGRSRLRRRELLRRARPPRIPAR